MTEQFYQEGRREAHEHNRKAFAELEMCEKNALAELSISNDERDHYRCENAAMRDALRQVNILLRSISAHDGPGFPHGTCCNLAGQALAKLQPFIK